MDVCIYERNSESNNEILDRDSESMEEMLGSTLKSLAEEQDSVLCQPKYFPRIVTAGGFVVGQDRREYQFSHQNPCPTISQVILTFFTKIFE